MLHRATYPVHGCPLVRASPTFLNVRRRKGLLRLTYDDRFLRYARKE